MKYTCCPCVYSENNGWTTLLGNCLHILQDERLEETHILVSWHLVYFSPLNLLFWKTVYSTSCYFSSFFIPLLLLFLVVQNCFQCVTGIITFEISKETDLKLFCFDVQYLWWALIYLGEKFAPGTGFEPRSPDLRAGALPLSYSAHTTDQPQLYLIPSKIPEE